MARTLAGKAERQPPEVGLVPTHRATSHPMPTGRPTVTAALLPMGLVIPVSSLILVIVVAVWATVLVPMLLRRHDEGAEHRSSERIATAFRVLARRAATAAPPAPAGRATGAPVPRRRAARVGVPWPDAPEDIRRQLLRTRPAPPPAPRSPADPSRHRPVRLTPTQAMARRRRLLAGLVALAVAQVAGVLAIGPGFWVGQLAADVMLVGYLGHLRQEAVRVRRRRARVSARMAGRRRPAAESGSPAPAARPAAPAATPAPRLPAAGTAPGTGRSMGALERQDDGSWLPVSVPLPSYVTAPPAAPAAAGHRGAAAAGRPLTDDEPDLRRRAVNE